MRPGRESGTPGSRPASHDQASLYEVLQVSPRASSDVIQAAYRALARRYHPDLSCSPETASLMQQLNAAYAVLGDANRRAEYDARRARASAKPTSHPRQPGRPRERPPGIAAQRPGLVKGRVAVILLIIAASVALLVGFSLVSEALGVGIEDVAVRASSIVTPSPSLLKGSTNQSLRSRQLRITLSTGS